MPSNIVNLEDVVPGIGGKTFVTPDGAEYSVPGDLPTSTTFELLSLFESLLKFQTDSSEQVAKNPTAQVIAKVRANLQAITDMIDEKLLAIFQIDQPDLQRLPFGSKSTNYILGEIFEMVGIASKDPAGGPLPNPPTKPKSRARAGATRKSQSRRKK